MRHDYFYSSFSLQQDIAAERSTLPYRAPELFEVPSDCVIDEKVDIWVGLS